MTNTILAVAAPEKLLPCPPWCTSHDGITHCSDWFTWDKATDAPVMEPQMTRHDEMITAAMVNNAHGGRPYVDVEWWPGDPNGM